MNGRVLCGVVLMVALARGAGAQALGGVVPAAAAPPATEPARAIEPDDDPPYDSAGRRDPFRPPRAVAATLSGEARTPLQRYEIGQLRLVAIIYEAREPSAVVEDDDGLGYILKSGTLVGANGGHVRTIERGRIVIEEDSVDFYGEHHPTDVVLELRTAERGKR
jgi:type IV pilus assembly protein PilP